MCWLFLASFFLGRTDAKVIQWCTMRGNTGLRGRCYSSLRWIRHGSQWIGLRENLQETVDFPITVNMGLSCNFSLKPIHWRWHDGKMEGKWMSFSWYFGRFLIGFCMFFFLNFGDDHRISAGASQNQLETGDFPWELAGSWGNLPEVPSGSLW